MNNPKQLVIIGGGSSISEGISKNLWNKIKNKFTFGINYSYKYFDSTVQLWLDVKFYNNNKEIFNTLPLVITKTERRLPNNMIQLKTSHIYHRDVRKGCWKGALTGIFALSLGIYLLDEGEIFLLGYDFGEARKKDYTKFAKTNQELLTLIKRGKDGKPLTHFYQGEIDHKGVGKINYYNGQDKAIKDFGVYSNEKKVKIYNVSLISKIPDTIFPKITYDTFFKMLNKNTFNQDQLRKETRERLR